MQLYENSRLFRYIASFRSCTPICNIRCNSRQEAEPASPLCPLTVFTGGEVCFRSALSFFAFAADVSPKPDLKWGTRPEAEASFTALSVDSLYRRAVCFRSNRAEPARPLCPLIVSTDGEVCFRSTYNYD